MSRRDDERGLAVPIVVVLASVLLVVSLLAAVLGRLLVDQRRAAAAADLAALAGATARQHGGRGCPEAGSVARANGATLAGCTVTGMRVRVDCEVTTPALLGRVVQLHATAYAGPTSYAGGAG
jgi:secretion/DNA translocation related TadE-like protein